VGQVDARASLLAFWDPKVHSSAQSLFMGVSSRGVSLVSSTHSFSLPPSSLTYSMSCSMVSSSSPLVFGMIHFPILCSIVSEHVCCPIPSPFLFSYDDSSSRSEGGSQYLLRSSLCHSSLWIPWDNCVLHPPPNCQKFHVVINPISLKKKSKLLRI